jgi:hypothetical protein
MASPSFVQTINDIGLRHVVSDLITSIKGAQEISEQRRSYAWAHLAQLFDDACIGELASTDPRSYVRQATRSSYGNYKKLSRAVVENRQLGSGDLKDIRSILTSASEPSTLKKKDRERLLQVLVAIEHYLTGVKPRLSVGRHL